MADTPTGTAPAEQREHEQEPGQVPDVELVREAQRGDGSAFAELVGRHQRQLYRLALRMTGSEADAQEVLQEAFLNAYQKLPNFRGEAQFSSWLYRIAANSALMRLRRKRRAPDALTDQPLELQGPRFSAEGYLDPAPRSDWSQRADEKMMDRELGTAIDQEIAGALDLTVPAVKSRLHRARLALREKLGEFFGE